MLAAMSDETEVGGSAGFAPLARQARRARDRRRGVAWCSMCLSIVRRRFPLPGRASSSRCESTSTARNCAAATRCRRPRRRTNCGSPSNATAAGWCRTGSTTTRRRAPNSTPHRPRAGSCLRDRRNRRGLVAFAGGSGITPIISLIRAALAGTHARDPAVLRQPRPDSVIFADALRRARRAHADRLVVEHHFDDDSGVVTPCGHRAVHRDRRQSRLLHLRARAVHGHRRDEVVGSRVCPADRCIWSASRLRAAVGPAT